MYNNCKPAIKNKQKRWSYLKHYPNIYKPASPLRCYLITNFITISIPSLIYETIVKKVI